MDVIVKRRRGRTEMRHIKEGLAEIVREYAPLSNRQLFYLAVVRHLIKKTQNDYSKIVCAMSVLLRQEGLIDWHDIIDETRWVMGVETHASMGVLLRESIRTYRADIWSDKDVRVQVWVESFSGAGLLIDTTKEWRVPLYPCRGYGSHGFLRDAAVEMERLSRKGILTHIYIFGDFDPSGKDIIRHTKEKLRMYGPKADVEFHEVAVVEEQIEEWNLPTAPPKKKDPRTAKFGDDRTVEMEAIHPDQFRKLVEDCITQHFDRDQLDRMMVAEDAQRETVEELLDKMGVFHQVDKYYRE